MPAVRAVTLDAAGTLIAVAEPVGETYARVAARHGVHVTAEAAEAGFRRAMASQAPLAFPGAGETERPARERAWWYAVVRAALGATSPGAALDAAAAELFAHYAGAAAWLVFPEVPAVLAALRARGLRLAVVSNFDGRLLPLLDALGISERVDAVVPSTLVGSAKPDARIFHAALARLDVSPAAALHVGDDLSMDVTGARRAGLRAALVDRLGRAPAAPAGVAVLRSLDRLPQLADAR
jgi:putative hydrolase of the HAD superfamily